MEDVTTKKNILNKKDSLFLIVLSAVAIFFTLTSLYSFLLFHTLAELFSIVIAAAIFIIAWNSREYIDNNYLLYLGIAYLFIGGVDFLHTLAYKGMNIFAGFDANLPTQLWIAGRYLEAATLIIAALLITKRFSVYKELAAYTIIFIAITVSVFSGFFPDCFIEGQGLTQFKIISEYIISIMLVLAIYLLFRQKDSFEPRIFKIIIISIFFTILSELAFTFYVSVYGFSNLVGHIFKLVSFALIYYALVETGIRRPYEIIFRNLHEKEKEAARERDTLDMYINISGVMFLVLDNNRIVKKINDEGCRILGYECKEITGRDFIKDFIPSARRDEVTDIFNMVIEGQITPGEYVENEVLTKNKETKTLLWNNSPIRDENGNITGILCSGEDITKRKESEEQLERTQFAFEHSPDEIYYVNREGRIIYANTHACESLGIDPDSPSDTTIFDFNHLITPKDWGEIWLLLKREKQYRFESAHTHPDGTQYPVDIIKYPIIYGDDNYSCTIARDITQRKLAEEKIKQSETRLRTLISTIPDLVWLKNEKGKYLTCNPAFERFFGAKESEIAGKTDYDFVDKDLADFFRENDIKAVRKGRPSVNEEWITFADSDNKALLETIKTPIYDSKGNIAGVLGIGRDITERKKSEDAIREANKKLNLLSSITRHDILNQITGAAGYLEMIKMDKEIPAGTKTEEYIEKITGAVDTIKRQITFTGYYKDLGEQKPEWFDAGKIIDYLKETSSFDGTSLINNIVDIEVFADPLFEKVIYNLIDNAVKHGETLTKITFFTEIKPNELVIYCEDDGVGVPAEFKEKIFKREYFKNSGLGLFLSGEILSITGLSIKETGTPGEGAKFEIHVPLEKFRIKK